jgi:hypothetical protein
MTVAFSLATLFLVLLSLRSVVFLRKSPMMKSISLLLIGYLVGIVGLIGDNVLTSYAPSLIANESVRGVLLALPSLLMFVIAGIAYLHLHGFITAEKYRRKKK